MANHGIIRLFSFSIHCLRNVRQLIFVQNAMSEATVYLVIQNLVVKFGEFAVVCCVARSAEELSAKNTFMSILLPHT